MFLLFFVFVLFLFVCLFSVVKCLLENCPGLSVFLFLFLFFSIVNCLVANCSVVNIPELLVLHGKTGQTES